ncbi:MAG TPA: hypothetical protein VI702_04605 [Nitrospiria bacterium]
MITGLNSEVEYQGKVYHVQTEDSGSRNPAVLTILFCSGAILTTRKTSYSDILKAENLSAIVKDLMHEQHTKMIKELQSGRIFLEVSQSSREAVPPPAAPKTDEPSPASPSGEGKKSLDDLILDYLSTKEDRKKP